MKNNLSGSMRRWMRQLAPGCLLLALTACAEFGFAPPPSPAPAPPGPQPQPVVVMLPQDRLPSLDDIIIEYHRSCETPGRTDDSSATQQQRDLMQWLRRNCNPGDAAIAQQLAALKLLQQYYDWPEAYVAWFGEWRRMLQRMQTLQQRAVTAEEAQATMVKRLRAIERDLTTRP
jgi:hypothetical protein